MRCRHIAEEILTNMSSVISNFSYGAVDSSCDLGYDQLLCSLLSSREDDQMVPVLWRWLFCSNQVSGVDAHVKCFYLRVARAERLATICVESDVIGCNTWLLSGVGSSRQLQQSVCIINKLASAHKRCG